MDKSISFFGLTIEQTQLLFSLQRLIILNDITMERNNGAIEKRKDIHENINELASILRGRKTEVISSAHKVAEDHLKICERKLVWFQEWEQNIQVYLKHLNNGYKLPFLESPHAAKIAIEQICYKSKNQIWKYLLLLECCLFVPYYPMNKDCSDKDKTLRKCKFLDNGTYLNFLSELLGVNQSFVEKFKNDYKKAIRQISRFWENFTKWSLIGMTATLAGIALFQPYLIFALPGTAGAAAFTSALAALGGGAVAAGGFGMVGGIVVLVGGGSLIGVAAGGGGSALISKMTVNLTLLESAKMSVILKDIILGVQKDTYSFQEILIEITKREQELKTEIIKLQTEKDKNKQRIKDLDKQVNLLEELLYGSRSYI